MKSLNPLDSILFYNKEDLQRQIEEEMTEKGWNKGQRESKMEIAKSLLSMGVGSMKQIATATGLSIEEIEELKENKA